jgi:hypothetical protein
MSDSYDAATTILVISSMGVPPYSARGLQQTLEPIQAAASMRRTVNGELKDISAPQFKKYSSQISCNDQQVPALSGVWPGDTVTVDCVARLAYLSVGGSAERPVVEGSENVEGDFTFYRPRLTMKVMSFNEQEDEYGATVSWNLQLEEI